MASRLVLIIPFSPEFLTTHSAHTAINLSPGWLSGWLVSAKGINAEESATLDLKTYFEVPLRQKNTLALI